ncbi:helix-turn-helix domain-containing protein [Bizionia gelidisalsuginis]|uniref:Helix-turn-helix domain-containing protein n=1 Tax=Bizionia gelidisalsuginis TaxID=291188 RepID=A0ABY3MEK4_9FLAO|nr:helix-turn-helix domain-containing protein [Bizionia gelidisalsuginis]TYC18037.1 helix-turn-helix domain-containing protein [Bizionia gelidisalsuginis]
MSEKVFILTEGLLDQLVEKLTIKIVNESQNQKSDSEELLGMNEASQLIKLTKPTLYGLVHRKKIPFCKKGKKLYFYKSELLEWINSGRASTKKDLEERANAYILKNSNF